MPRQWPPGRLLYAGLTIGVLLAFAAVYLATHLPRAGIETEPGVIGVRVTAIAGDSGLAGKLRPGDEIIALRADGMGIRLEPGDAVAEPDDAADFSTYNRFFDRQQILWSLWNAPDAEIAVVSPRDPPAHLARSIVSPRYLTLERSHSASLSSLPMVFWSQIVCGLAIFWLGIGAWAFVQNERGPFFYALASLALALAICSSAVYTTRELTMAPDLFLLLSRINQFGAMLFAGAGTTLLWYYPVQLGRFRFERLMVPLVALILAANWGQWVDSLDLIARATLIVWAIADIALAWRQWRLTTRQPVARARLKWFVLSWFGGVMAYLLLVVVPQLISQPSLLHQKWAWFLFVLSYIGIALGIVRYRLFDLDRWILVGWFWFLCGILFIVVDAALIVLLDISTTLSLLTTLAIAGWLYFPLRQVLMHRLMPRATRDRFYQQLPDLISEAFDSRRDIGGEWPGIIRRTLQPLQLEAQPEAVRAPIITHSGLHLLIPTPSGQGSLRLGYADNGQRLFDRDDVAFAERTLTLFRYAEKYRHSFRQGVMEERQRVARDLHDDVGARLLSVIYRAGETEAGQLARECLRELRDVIQGLQKQQTRLDRSFDRWQQETASRCQLFNLELNTSLAPSAAVLALSPRSERNLMSILREFVTNTLKHADADRIDVHVSAGGPGQLLVDCCDNGRGLGPEAMSGVGTHSIRERASEIGGTVSWYCTLPRGTGLLCTLPLVPARRPITEDLP